MKKNSGMEIKNKVQYIKTSKLSIHPKNPRIINDDKFKQLCQSISDNPDYFETRPILCNPEMIVFAGNQRLKAAKELKIDLVPVVIMDISEEKQKELMIRDNVNQGEFDWNELINEWDQEQLKDWGVEIIDYAKGLEVNSMNDDDVNLDSEFDPYGIAKNLHKIVF